MMRSYVNRLARFSSPDLLSGSTGDPQSLNRFNYALNDPLNLADPSGLTTCDANGNNCYDSVEVTADGPDGGSPLDPFGGAGGAIVEPPPPLIYMGGRKGGGGRDAEIKDLIHQYCDGIRKNGGGFVTFFGGTASVSFDGAGLLNGVFQQLTDENEATTNVLGNSVTLAPNTVGYLTWTNAPSFDRQFTVGTSKGVTISGGTLGVSAVINSVNFNGLFHVNGGAFVLWTIPIGAGPIESKLNGNPNNISAATNLENKLYNSKINCEDALGFITMFSKIGP